MNERGWTRTWNSAAAMLLSLGAVPGLAQQAPADAPAVAAPPVAAVPAPRPVCNDCGTVETVREIEKKGEGSGVGMVGGAVVGGLLGHQVGQGRGNTAATILGAGAGAFAGHQVEKSVRSGRSYEVVVRFEDGRQSVFPYNDPPRFRNGDRVRLVNGVLQPGQ